MKTFAEQVAALKATREEKQNELKAIAQKSMDESRTMDNAEQEAFDTLQEEIIQIDGDIRRLSLLADMDKKSVEPVKSDKASAPAHRGLDIELKKTEKVEDGIGFARYARIKALSRLENASPLAVAKHMYPNHGQLHDVFGKTAVPAASTDQTNVGSSPTWAGDLILDGGAFFADFVEFLRPKTVIGQVSDKLRSLPFDTQVLIQASGGTAKWVKEGHAKPLTSWGYTSAKLAPLKVAAIAAATKETLRRASRAADVLIRDELAKAVIAALDGTFLSDDAAVPGESPAGLLVGANLLNTVLVGSGSHGVDGIKCDIAEFLKAIVAENLSLSNCFWVISERTAIDLTMAQTLAGTPAFPGMTVQGGTLAGIPVVTSEYVDYDATAGQTVILAKGDEIFLADEGGIDVSVSDQASLLMDNAPSMNSVTPTSIATSTVSMWQTNSVAFLVERFMNWMKRREKAVVYGLVDWDCGLK